MRMGVTLRFLAMGDTYTRLMYHLRISKQQLSDLIPEVCLAVYDKLKKIIKVRYKVANINSLGTYLSIIPSNYLDRLCTRSLLYINISWFIFMRARKHTPVPFCSNRWWRNTQNFWSYLTNTLTKSESLSSSLGSSFCAGVQIALDSLKK